MRHHLHPGAGVGNRRADDVTAKWSVAQNAQRIANTRSYFRAHRRDSYAESGGAAISCRDRIEPKGFEARSIHPVFDNRNGNGYTSLVVSRSRTILALPIIVWLAVAAQVDARVDVHEFKAIVFKKGSPDLGEKIPQK